MGVLAVRPSVRVRPSVSAAAAPVGRSAKHGGRTAHVKLVTCVLIAFNGSASKVRCPPLGLQFSSADLGIVLTYSKVQELLKAICDADAICHGQRQRGLGAIVHP